MDQWLIHRHQYKASVVYLFVTSFLVITANLQVDLCIDFHSTFTVFSMSIIKLSKTAN